MKTMLFTSSNCNGGLIYEQVAENLGATEKNPNAADTGVEGDNTEGCKANVEFFHGFHMPIN